MMAERHYDFKGIELKKYIDLQKKYKKLQKIFDFRF